MWNEIPLTGTGEGVAEELVDVVTPAVVQLGRPDNLNPWSEESRTHISGAVVHLVAAKGNVLKDQDFSHRHPAQYLNRVWGKPKKGEPVRQRVPRKRHCR